MRGAWGPLFSLQRPHLAIHRGCITYDATEFEEVASPRCASLPLSLRWEQESCLAGVKGLITEARRTEPRVQGSKCQLILLLSLLFSRLHAFLPAELLPVPLGSSWGVHLRRGTYHPPGAATTGIMRPCVPASARCGFWREGPGARSKRAVDTGSRDRRGPHSPRSGPPRPFGGGGVGAGRDSFSSPRRRRRTAWLAQTPSSSAEEEEEEG